MPEPHLLDGPIFLLKSFLTAACALCLLAIGTGCTTGKAGSKPAGSEHDAYRGSLRNYSYEFRIWWDGQRCERREIRIRRTCGLCRGEVTKARFYDYDCDGAAEQFVTRAEHQNFEADRRTLEEEAWHAFFLIVPPSQTGDSRKVLPGEG